jgi:hypothetical protein
MEHTFKLRVQPVNRRFQLMLLCAFRAMLLWFAGIVQNVQGLFRSIRNYVLIAVHPLR